MIKKRNKFILTLAISSLFIIKVNAQFGEFGEFRFKFSEYIGNTDIFLSDNLGNFTSGSYGYSETEFNSSLIFELTYSRFYPLNLSNYISWGLGYRLFDPNLNLSINSGGRFSSTDAAISISQQHYVNIPLKFHQYINIKSNQRDDELLTSRSAIKDAGYGLNVHLGINFYYSVSGVETEISLNENQEKTDRLLEISENLSKNYNRLIFEPELGVDILLGDFSFGASISYQLNKLYDNNEIIVPYADGSERPFKLNQDFDSNILISLSATLKH